ncbi:unnamed protein product [Owenia fusiformis]|uniref:Uncharacterized protein n=1 Tax=Owenia fusiformis TaxID=6347 RepID=A0A8J1TYV7_OWEFU|nr:unnamed protein product [Owenia fusiformis]
MVRMGSGASSNVKKIEIDQDNDEFARPRSSKKKAGKAAKDELDQTLGLLEKCRASLSEEERRSNTLQSQTKDLQIQLSEIESTNLDLKEEIQRLEERLEYMNNQNQLQEDKECPESMQIKDQYIEKLETKTKLIQEETDQLKARFKKKIKKVGTQLAETKQESTLKIFELKDEITRLANENAQLLERLSHAGHENSPRDVEPKSSEEDNKSTFLVLELSRQISDQDSKICTLEQNLKEKDKIIKDLKMKLKTALNPPKETKPEINGAMISYGAEENEKESEEYLELKKIAKDIKKYHKKKRKEKVRNFDDFRESSSKSRDSGILDEDEPGYRHISHHSARSQRLTSATSTVSRISLSSTAIDSESDAVSQSSVREIRNEGEASARSSARERRSANRTKDRSSKSNLNNTQNGSQRYSQVLNGMGESSQNEVGSPTMLEGNDSLTMKNDIDQIFRTVPVT